VVRGVEDEAGGWGGVCGGGGWWWAVLTCRVILYLGNQELI